MSGLRANMTTYFDALEDDFGVLLVPRQGKRKTVVTMTLSEFNSIIETDYLLSTWTERFELDLRNIHDFMPLTPKDSRNDK